MEQTELHIKNMVCDRCILAVKEELKKLQFNVISVVLGKVVVEGIVEPETKSELDRNLRGIGFELIDDRKSQLIERIKTEIINLVHYDKEIEGPFDISDHLASTLGYDYSYLSTLFSSVAGITIEKYFILQRIERVKELLVYGELNLSEIA